MKIVLLPHLATLPRQSRIGAALLSATVLGIASPALAQDAALDLMRQFGQVHEEAQRILDDIELPRFQGDLAEQVEAAAAQRAEVSGEADGTAHVVIAFTQPPDQEAVISLQDQGVRLLERADPRLWYAEVDPEGAAALNRTEAVIAATLVPPAAKISALFSGDERPGYEMTEDGRRRVTLLFHIGVSAEEARDVAESLDLEIERFDPETFATIRSMDVTVEPQRLGALALPDAVRLIEPIAPPDIDYNLNNSQPVSNVDVVQVAPYDLDGSGVTIGIWEAGDHVRPTHQDLTPRVTVQPAQTPSQDGHALHVAGTIGASGTNAPAAEGMAPSVNILSWDSGSDGAEMTTASAPAASPRIVASNHSYGAVVGWNGGAFTNNQNVFGAYNANSVAFDTVVAGNGVTVAPQELVIAVAAGNDRNDGPGTPAQPQDCLQGALTPPGGGAFFADCLSPRASAKNVLSVGAMNGGALIAGFSSFGPTDDGRIKPDLMANGTTVTSLGSFGPPPGGGPSTDDIAQTDTGTWVAQGTSMATPVVTGIAALMAEEFQSRALQPIAATYKAILVQTARDVAGTGQATPGPDFATGWGIADAEAALDLIRRAGGPGYAEGTMTATGAANAWTFPFTVPPGEAELSVTLAWSDLPSPAGTPGLVNDLDLRLIPPGGGTPERPWTLNPAQPWLAAVQDGGDDATNNVEQVAVTNPSPGTWTAQVSAKPGSLALGPQRFAVAGPLTPDAGPIAGPKANIMVVLDKSGSMVLPAATSGLTKMEALQNAASAFTDYMDLVGGHNMGVVAFDTNVRPTTPNFSLQALDATTAPDAQTAIGNLAPGGFTSIIAGITEAATQIAGPGGTNADDVIVLFSDGRHNRPAGSDVSAIDMIMANDTRFFSIGFGTDVDSTIMPGVAGNHDGVHLEEQDLQAGQLAKLFMVVGGLAVDEAIILDPDYPIAPGGLERQSIYAAPEDRTLTFAGFWTTPASEMELMLVGPDRRCKIPPRTHNGYDTRSGPLYRLIRVEIPYRCTGGPTQDSLMHEGIWTLQARNRGNEADIVKVMALADSSIDLSTEVKPRGREAVITARLVDGDVVLGKGVRMFVDITLNQPSSGDSEKQDAITGDDPIRDPGTILIPDPFGGIVSGGIVSPMAEPRIRDRGLELAPDNVGQVLIPRARALELRPEILEQLRGRFTAPTRSFRVGLRDDGQGGDSRASDGVFTAVVQAPRPGLYGLRLVASQARPGGQLTREALSSFVAR